MRFLLFVIKNCKDCDAFHKFIAGFSIKKDIPLKVYDLDDERYLLMGLKACQKYKIKRTPSLVLLDEENRPILVSEKIEEIRSFLSKK